MNRKDFFKRLGIGVLAVVVAPKILAEEELNPVEFKPKSISSHIKASDDVIDSLNGLYYNSEVYYKAQLKADFKLSEYINDEIFSSF
jgi:hypothetical protein